MSASPPHLARRISNLISVALRLACTVLAALVIAELFDTKSRGHHVLGSVWLPSAIIAGFAATIALCSVALDARRPLPATPLPHLLRDVFVLGTLAIVAQIVLSKSYKPVLFDLCFGIAGGALAMLRLADRRWTDWRERKAIRVFGLAALQASLILAISEFSLRTVAAIVPNPMFARDDSTVESALAMHRFEPGTLHYGFPINSGHNYDHEFQPGTKKTVVSIGDSFSIGVVPHSFLFTSICEKELDGIAVHNIGTAGIGPGGYLWLLQDQGLALKPDLILINLFAGNDVMESLRFNGKRSVLRSFCDKRNVLSYQVPVRLWRLISEGEQKKRPAQIGGWLHGENLLTRATSDPSELIAAFPWIEDPALEQPQISEEQFLRIESSRAEEIHDGKRHGAYERMFAVLDEILMAAAETPMVIMLIPDEFQIEDSLWEQVQHSLASKNLDRDQPQKRIRSWLETRNIPYLDLLPLLRAAPAMPDGRKHLYHLRDTHFNVRGNRVAGLALARFLRDKLH